MAQLHSQIRDPSVKERFVRFFTPWQVYSPPGSMLWEDCSTLGEHQLLLCAPGSRMDSSDRWSKEMVYEFAAYKLIMWPIGVWPRQNMNNFGNFRVLLSSMLEITMIASIVSELRSNRTTGLEVMIDLYGLIACAIIALTKIVIIRAHRSDLVAIFDSVRDNWTFTKNQDQRTIMMHHARRARMVLIYQVISSSVVVFSMILTPSSFSVPPNDLGNSSQPLITYLPIGSQCVSSKTSTSCDVTYALQSVQLMCTALGNVGIDVFVFGVAMHLCGQFTVMAEDIMQFGAEESNRTHCRCRMIDFVKKHSLVLDLAGKLKDTLNLVLFVQLFLNALDICLLGIQLILSLNTSDFVRAARALSAFMVLMMQLFLYSYLGESLASKIETIGQAVYLSNWYNVSPNIVRDLHFIIARARIPFSVTAGGFYSMNLNNFKNILKASASYVSVLQIMIIK